MQAIKSLYRFYIKSFLIILFLLISHSSTWAQASQKRLLTPQDYHLWSSLWQDKISSNGNWTSYGLRYEYTGKDTLIVKKTYGNRSYAFPGSKIGKFNGELDFACMQGDTLALLDLKSGKLAKTPRVANFAFSANQKFVLVLLKQADQKFTLEVRDRAGSVVEKVSDIAQYSFDFIAHGIVYSTVKDNSCSVEFMLLKDAISKKRVVGEENALFKNFVWKGNSITFIKTKNEEVDLFIYHISQDKLHSLDPKKVRGFPADMKVSDGAGRMMLSEDGERVIFSLKENKLNSNFFDPNQVEIWNTVDKELFGKKIIVDYVMSEKKAIWNLKENSVLQITDKQLPSGFLNADFNYAFIYDRNAYEPQTDQIGAYDLYLLNLKSGEKKRIVERYTFGEYIPSRSPDGRYLCYPKESHWWIYDIQQDIHFNITLALPNSFFLEDKNRPQEADPYGIGGWTNEGEVILFDRYDLWKISLDGKVKIRLTKGREIQKAFRIYNHVGPTNFPEPNRVNLDLHKGLMLTAANKEIGATGLSYWSPKSGVRELLWENKKISRVVKAENKDSYMYVEESYASSPRLMVYNGKAREIVSTNKQQERFNWGKNEPIEYMVNGIRTKGVLFYPAGYNPDLKYPMVVYIYERQFANLNSYVNPSLLSYNGFNVSNYIAQGYFVLFPDINYEYGNLRESVTKSVLSAVDEVLAKGSVDPKKVGLIGHSFGGYETNLIITQTNRFATAVAGAGWSDLISEYLSFGQETLRPDFFRAENQQLRIGKSLYEDMQSYFKNSPVLLADQVKTPLLGWAGKKDETINPLQSMEFFLALRRTNKEHTLLLYPTEGHQIDKKENRIDLSVRIMQWFDYYLKDGKKQDWMNSNLNWQRK